MNPNPKNQTQCQGRDPFEGEEVPMAEKEWDEAVDFSILRGEVWEIGLAVLVHKGVCPFFRHINEALDGFDLRRLTLIRDAALALPPELQHQFWGAATTPEKLADAVLVLETLVLELLEGEALPLD